MKKIKFEDKHRQDHFDFFNGMNHPHFNLTSNVEVTKLIPFIKKNKLPMTFCIVYLISKTANEIPEFKQRIRDKAVVEHRLVNPSFTVKTEKADVFSFCTVPYVDNPKSFIKKAEEVNELMLTNPSIKDEPGRDDYLFLSAIPWVSFTGIQHAMSYHPGDSVPRITWGKYFEQNEKLYMPLAIQVHHALVDGRHVGQYYTLFETMTQNPEAYLKYLL
jgi:chloramphenicol O-acetyltransferase type A